MQFIEAYTAEGNAAAICIDQIACVTSYVDPTKPDGDQNNVTVGLKSGDYIQLSIKFPTFMEKLSELGGFAPGNVTKAWREVDDKGRELREKRGG